MDDGAEIEDEEEEDDVEEIEEGIDTRDGVIES